MTSYTKFLSTLQSVNAGLHPKPSPARAQTLIASSLLADAATMGLHWIYNQQDIATKISGRQGGEFFEPPSCPFYTYESGKFSPYGDEIIPVLRSMATEGALNFEHAAATSYEYLKSYEGRLNHCSKLFIENRDAGKDWRHAGADDHQTQGIIKVPLLVARKFHSCAYVN